MANHRLVYTNTLFLYFRAFISMGLALYTSRLVLEYLGIEDFGIYSIVGSLTTMFAYLNWSISSSLTRFLAVDIAKNDLSLLKKCFSSSILASLYITILIVILCETVGIWALYHLLEIPPEKQSQAFTVFQTTIFILVLELFKTCYQSLIIAYEKMSFFAYVSVIESVLRLVVAVMLIYCSSSRLLFYAYLLCGVSMLILLIYIIYCRKKFPWVTITLNKGKERLKEIVSFTGWNALASFADLCYMQGSNILLNMFYGVAYNATMGVINQLKNALYSFTKNLQTASYPHLTKEFAKKDYTSFEHLTGQISILSVLLLFIFGLPLLINAPLVIKIWLVDYPPQIVLFTRLMIIFCLVDSLVGPLWGAMQAYGKIRNYQIIMSLGWLLYLPLTWMAFKAGSSPATVLTLQIVINTVLLTFRIYFAVKYCHIRLSFYLKNVLFKIFLSLFIPSILVLVLYYTVISEWGLFISSTVVTLIFLPLCTFFFGLDAMSREKVLLIIKSKLGHAK